MKVKVIKKGGVFFGMWGNLKEGEIVAIPCELATQYPQYFQFLEAEAVVVLENKKQKTYQKKKDCTAC